MSDARPVVTPEHNADTESMIDSIDRLRNDGGVAPELPHDQPKQVRLTPTSATNTEAEQSLS